MKDKYGTLQVRGTGTIQVAPDEAVVHLQVITEGKTASEAVEANATTTQAVITAVSKEPNHGVTTTGLGVNPIVTYDPNKRVPTIVGFRATNGVEIKTKPGYSGQVYDAGFSAGANQSSGITLRVQHPEPHREEALRVATKKAFKEAQIVADTADVDLLSPESISIDQVAQPLYYRSMALDAKAATPVIPDAMSITASVQIVFRTHG